MTKVFTSGDLEKLDGILRGAKHLLIVVHTNPDPDAIASASALKYLITQRNKMEISIAYSGNIGRAENNAMLKDLDIHMKQISKITWAKYDRVALVDTQPGSGNNAVPKEQKCQLVFDHHPTSKKSAAENHFINSELGVLATMFIELIRLAELEIPSDLATALAYAISSESQNLKREVHQRDIDAYLYVFVRANLRKLAQIILPPLPREYYLSVAKTLQKAVSYRNLIVAHLGEIPSAEIVPEMADFLVRHERISWSLCTGRLKDRLIISLRSRNAKAAAGKMLQEIVGNTRTVGGHGMFAGGFIDVSNMNKDDIQIMEATLSKKFAESHGYENPDWKPLFEISNK